MSAPLPLLCAALLAGPGGGAEPAVPRGVATIAVADPGRFASRPAAAAVAGWAADSRLPGPLLDRPETEAARVLLAELAGRAGAADGPTLLRSSSAGGLVAAVELDAGGTPSAAATLTAADAGTPSRTLAAVRAVLVDRLGGIAAFAVPASAADGVPFPVGGAVVRVDGPRFHATTGPNPPDLAAVPPLGPDDLLRVTVDLAAARSADADLRKLAPPGDDAGGAALLGGYLAAVGTADSLTATLSGTDAGTVLTVRLDGTDVPAGFFAAPGRPVPAPLRTPGTLYTAAWHRDYRRLWGGRGDWLSSDAADRLAAADDDQRRQLSVLGADVLPSEFLTRLGPSFRFVVLRGPGVDYRIPPPDRLPAAGLVVELRDGDRFRDLLAPLTRGVTLVATLGEAKLEPFRAEHRGTPLDGLRFPDSPGSLAAGNLARLNAAPTWALSDGHLVVATDPATVGVLLDALAASPADEAATLPAGVTERQELHFAPLADAAGDVRDTILRALVLRQGLTPAEAAVEAELLDRLLRSFVSLNVETRADGDTLEFRLGMHVTPVADR